MASDRVVVKLSARGQLVVPKALRTRLGLRPGDALAVQGIDGDRLVVEKVRDAAGEIEALRREAKRKGFGRRELAKAIREARQELYAERGA